MKWSDRHHPHEDDADVPPESQRRPGQGGDATANAVEQLLVQEEVVELFARWLRRQDAVDRDLLAWIYVSGLPLDEACANAARDHIDALDPRREKTSEALLAALRTRKTRALNRFRAVLCEWMRAGGGAGRDPGP